MSSHHGHDHSHAVVTEDNAKKLTFALGSVDISSIEFTR